MSSRASRRERARRGVLIENQTLPMRRPAMQTAVVPPKTCAPSFLKRKGKNWPDMARGVSLALLWKTTHEISTPWPCTPGK